MNRVVMKFGGTSVGSAENIAHVAGIVKSASGTPVVVVSALSKVTDTLIELSKAAEKGGGDDILKNIHERHESVLAALGLPSYVCENELTELDALVRHTKSEQKVDKKSLDHFQSFGERLCAAIVAAQLSKTGILAQAFPAWELGMITNDTFGNAEPLQRSYALLKDSISKLDVVPVVTGFIGKTESGAITTLGRGGSDFTAAIIGAAVGAEKIQIWKEVDGFMTTDPRLVPEAKIVPELAFEEASELAYFGAKVLHPKTILPAMKAGIPVQVLNTFKPDEKGTRIVSNFEKRKMTSQAIDALTFRKGVAIIRIYSPEFFDGNKMIADIFNLFADHNVNIGDVALSVASISLVMDNSEPLPEEVLTGLKKMGEVTIMSGKAMVCVVGGSKNTASVAGGIFSTLGKNNISVDFIAQASSGYSITFVVDETEAEHALKLLHKEFIEGTL